MFGLGLVQRTVPVPLICSTTNALEVEQFEDLPHGDLATKLFEIDAWHDDVLSV